MADVILKNNAGKIWVNGAGKVLKAKQFSEIPIQDGLAFWGQADPALLTIVDGLVSEAYDVRDGYGGARKMIQNTVSLRPSLITDYLLFNGKNIVINSQNLKSMFVVISARTYLSGLLINGTYKGIGVVNTNNYIKSGGSVFPGSNIPGEYFYANNTKTQLQETVGEWFICHSLTDLNVINLPIYLTSQTDTYNAMFKEWGWYNRVLSETEVIYNINCLNQKYSIF
jgi:hypothetical protein